MDAARKSFREKTEDLEDPIIEVLRQTILNPKIKHSLKLKACEMILKRREPELKSVDVKNTRPTTFIFMSPQERAAEKLASLDDTQRQKAIEGLTIHEGVRLQETMRVIVDPDADSEILYSPEEETMDE